MTAVAVVLLVLGFLFATLQYPAPMKRFWKWTLIAVASVALAVAVAAAVIAVRETGNSQQVQKDISFDDLIPKKAEAARAPQLVTDPELIKQLEAAPIRVQTPDGSIYEFPSVMSKAEIEQVMRRLYPAPKN